MKIVCPKCRAEIPAGSVNAEKDYALCPACGEAFRPSDMLANNTGREEQISPNAERGAPEDIQLNEDFLRNPPAGTWVSQEGFNIYIGASTRSPAAFFLVPFTCLWSGGALFGIYGTQILSGKFDVFRSLFGLPFLAGAVLLWGITLTAVLGKIEICLGQASYVFKGVGSFGLRKFFNWDAVTRVYEARSGRRVIHARINPMSESGGPTEFEEDPRAQAIFLEGGTRLKIGGRFLGAEKRRFLLTALTYFYREKHKTTF